MNCLWQLQEAKIGKRLCPPQQENPISYGPGSRLVPARAAQRQTVVPRAERPSGHGGFDHCINGARTFKVHRKADTREQLEIERPRAGFHPGGATCPSCSGSPCYSDIPGLSRAALKEPTPLPSLPIAAGRNPDRPNLGPHRLCRGFCFLPPALFLSLFSVAESKFHPLMRNRRRILAGSN